MRKRSCIHLYEQDEVYIYFSIQATSSSLHTTHEEHYIVGGGPKLLKTMGREEEGT